MKTAGLSSKVKKEQRHTAKTQTFANLQVIHFGAKEKQKSLRMQAERAQWARQKREDELKAASESSPKA